jgi:hypothetical protein
MRARVSYVSGEARREGLRCERGMKKKNGPIRSVPSGHVGDRDRNGNVETMRPCATRQALSGLRPVALSGRVVTDPIITL